MTAPPDYGLMASGLDFDKSLSQLKVDLALPSPADAHATAYDLDSIAAFQKAANYLALAQIYLLNNALAQQPLDYQRDVKKRLLGHWGTCPGLIFAYTHITALISRSQAPQPAAGTAATHDNDGDADRRRFLFVTGPGHGAPAILSTLYLEGSISRFYPDESLTHQGLERFVKNFSWPNTVRPSHVTATTPGAIHEGGELGYALAVAYGSVQDLPDLITVAVIGDGEAETGPTAAAWHAHKFIDPAESGAVLPILHLNRFKISEKTIFGSMDEAELVTLFSGYGYQVRVVDYYRHLGNEHTQPGDERARSVDIDMAVSIDWAYAEIRKIQAAARNGEPIRKPRWPMIILSTPKGWGCPQTVDGSKVEGSFRSHQIPIKVQPEGNDEHLQLLQDWLLSYSPSKWFTTNGQGGLSIDPLVTRILPRDDRLKMGQLDEIYTRSAGLDDVGTAAFMAKAGKDESSGKMSQASAMVACGDYLAALMPQNKSNLRIFSPDELASNHLDATLKTDEFKERNFQADADALLTAEDRRSGKRSGRVVEMLSEHTLQGFSQGYALTGRIPLFPSYESFLGIVATMIEQYAKFLKVSKETDFRAPVPSITYIETSTLWRQEHNGYSHQNPGLINTVLNLPHNVARVYLPPDANCALSTLSHCLNSREYVNLIVGSKHETPVYLSADEANAHCKAGASVWPAYSTDAGEDPDIVLVGIGTEPTAEVIAASRLLREDPKSALRVRVVNVTDLMILAEASIHPHALTDDDFERLFTKDRPLVISFHGYTSAIKGLLSDRLSSLTGRRPTAYLGYVEEGTTTTPWSMLRLNHIDRFTVACRALELVAHEAEQAKARGAEPRAHIDELIRSGRLEDRGKAFQQTRTQFTEYVEKHGQDPQEVSQP
ncbi:uncharacterized protein PFL1_02226 [Pseudozyma flocculosa PF-1]|uniref:Probable xylulose-5-phosphate/fructose-6-phosphate phosphoketolase n=1 Tax=Pseudozyma flocculosa TaxID=84751 RepID=A0A5C3FDC4_9BASI|nr:uncharacterized protein PFL1_02226 [Pseudozyma flocculosa PF-1]EPQ30109.1 hypothetical protein PFL1_02226 [Pseudozyma flocculosa PF-1]SPO41461.1 probable xylulose-5-phosphate/fructose-6-phosphate phosphoketolase [Pseudozyma flocculosa]